MGPNAASLKASRMSVWIRRCSGRSSRGALPSKISKLRSVRRTRASASARESYSRFATNTAVSALASPVRRLATVLIACVQLARTSLGGISGTTTRAPG
jgi:hypothetical protein